MMSSVPPLSQPVLVPTLYRVCALLDDACRHACDIDLVSCAALADIAARPRGFATREAREWYHGCDETAHFDSVLRERELVELVRFERDRRALAYLATPKGLERALLADRACGFSLVDAYDGLTEESFDKLVELFCDFAQAQARGTGGGAGAGAAGGAGAAAGVGAVGGASAGADRLFPARVLRALAVWQRAAVMHASRFGMTLAQVAVLVLVDAQGESRVGQLAETAEDDLAAKLGLPEPVLEAQMDSLRSRGLVADDEGLTGAVVTDAGAQRIAVFMQRLSNSLAVSVEGLAPYECAALNKLLQYVLYLFS